MVCILLTYNYSVQCRKTKISCLSIIDCFIPFLNLFLRYPNSLLFSLFLLAKKYSNFVLFVYFSAKYLKHQKNRK